MNSMKITAFFCLWLLAAGAGAQTSSAGKACRYPVRVFNGRTVVNLTPLFDWWKRQPQTALNLAESGATNNPAPTDRPLAAWDRVTGVQVGTVGANWLVSAVVYTSPSMHTNERVILNNPPMVEAQNYYAATAQLANVASQIVNVRNTYDLSTNAEQQYMQRAENFRHSSTRIAATEVVDNTKRAERSHAEAARALTQLGQLQQTRKQLEAQMREIPSDEGEYRVDWFAMEAGRTKGGVPIYDLGMVDSTKP